MQNSFAIRLMVFMLLFLCVHSHAQAKKERSLISTLYHPDVIPDVDEEAPHFTLDGQLGVLFATGNSASTSIKGGIVSEHETRWWSNRYFGELLYKESEKGKEGEKEREVTAERLYGYAQFDYKLNHRDRRLFIYGDYENDEFNGFHYRSSIAAGWSHQLLQNEVNEFRYSVGPGYSFVSVEEETETSINNGFIARASAEYRYFWTTGAKFRQFGSIEAGSHNIKTRSETSVTANIFSSLALKFAVTLTHETNTPEDVAELNTESSISLIYRFF
ncbi:DUF481 domain-containing protein [Alteromonas sp. ASW11-130]|uniref:DUF481 domain-containing protein n=1 Tax=Alteromonas sp. ASW11-130 TaxID=3015775 RepID=UPI002241A8A8|nr:DUF481 domain-containing protein [Alteromonas sp. ASW11-130]MCW8091589.1 DUF481 domain-containing protein [Alteromonas sp. ASW11-130]